MPFYFAFCIKFRSIQWQKDIIKSVTDILCVLNDCSSLITEKDHLNSRILGVYVCLCVR